MSSPSTPRNHQVGPDTIVSFSYRLFDAEGECVETSAEDEAFNFCFGYGQAAPVLEAGISGARQGDVRRIEFRARDAFGERDPEAVITVDRAEFAESLQIGDEFEAEDASGEVIPLKVLEMEPDYVVLDTNHPLAGQRVALELTVRAVRPALQEELEEAAAALAEKEFGAATSGGQDPAGEQLLPLKSLLKHLRSEENSDKSSASAKDTAPVETGSNSNPRVA